MNGDKAYLSNDKDMIKFQYGDKIIRFRGAYSLERFMSRESIILHGHAMIQEVRIIM